MERSFYEVCANCGKDIFQKLNGNWYHRASGSKSCTPKTGSAQAKTRW